ncbi:MAG: cysteine hydrolase [Candidatus Pacebacteria bacterium]|nr:cysteine hydrolase [Candidatus Paceibacterota bacterium]
MRFFVRVIKFILFPLIQNKQFFSKKTPDERAVILVDMQKDFVVDLFEDVRASIVDAQVRVIRACAKENIPLFVLEFRGEGRTIVELECEINRVPRVKFITKKRDNGFIRTSLGKDIKRLGVTAVSIMGMNAHACVLDTAKTALATGLHVSVPENLIADACNTGIRTGARQWYLDNGCFKKDVFA